MPAVFTTHYGKRYRQILVSKSRKRANIVAHALLLILKEDMDVKEKVLVLVEHDGGRHRIFVKCPYDKLIKKK